MKSALLLSLILTAVSCSKTQPKGAKVTAIELPDIQIPTTADEGFAAKCSVGLTAAKQKLTEIESLSVKPNVANFLVPYNDMMVAASHSGGMAGLLSEVHPQEVVRDAARECSKEVSKFYSSLSLNKNIYDKFAAIDTEGFDADTKRFVSRAVRDFKRAGVDKDEATRTKLEELDKKLTQAGQDFSKNISSDTRFIEVDSESDLAGMPADYIKAHPKGANGKIKITTDYPDYLPFAQYAKSNELRRKLYIKFKERGGEKNENVLRDILKLRNEKAKLLGYSSWAAYVTEDKMIKSEKAAGDFIDRVAKLSQKRAQRDYQELLDRKKKEVAQASDVQDYEKTYYENLVKKEEYAFDSQEIRPYFEYNAVENGLLKITSEIYGLEYKPAGVTVWHEDVKSFDVFREGEKIGRIYLDMHPREGKYKHAAQFPFRSGAAGRRLPEGVLVCNFPNPRTTDGPALMEHDDVTTMFHEFGHLMHHIIGGHQKWLDQSGVATEWDFVEAPSQMFEEWAWKHQTLKRFAKHHKTGAEIPEELVAKMQKARKFGVGIRTVQQMFYASVSLQFYMADPETLDMTAKVKELQAKYTPFEYVDGTRFHANFGHLNGYSAIYYTYMWSEVIAKDLLTPFETNGLMSEEWNSKYRDVILKQGGTKDAADLVAEFLGREYNFKAFETYLNE